MCFAVVGSRVLEAKAKDHVSLLWSNSALTVLDKEQSSASAISNKRVMLGGKAGIVQCQRSLCFLPNRWRHAKRWH